MTEQHDVRHLLEWAQGAATAGDLVSADELLREAARIQEEELGPHHPDLANTLNNLAIVAEKTGSWSDAETFYRRAAAIATAALPADHPMRVESRQNLEDFCRARGLPIKVPAVITAQTNTEVNAFASEEAAPDPIPDRPERITPDSTPGNTLQSLQWVAIGAVVAAVLLLLRPWSSRDAPSAAPPPVPAAAQPVEAAPPPVTAPPAKAAPIEQPAPPASAPPRDDRKVPTKRTPAASGIAVASAQLCRTFSTSGSNWRCDAVGDSAAPGRMVFYTRIRSPRDTEVVHRWYRGSTLRQSVTLPIQASATEGYRTYSRLTLDKGDWRLEVRSEDGKLLHEQRFAVQ